MYMQVTFAFLQFKKADRIKIVSLTFSILCYIHHKHTTYGR